MSYSVMKRAAILAVAASMDADLAVAQDRLLRVVSTDSEPVAYAYVSVQGGRAQISDERGLVSMGAGKKQTLSVEVRRIGYTPYFGKMDFPDSAATLTVVLPRLAQSLAAVKVTGSKVRNSLEMSGYYQRAIEGQKGALTAVFIGPEELEKRNASSVSALLTSINGITMARTRSGHAILMSTGAMCPLAIVMDGRQVCPLNGCQGNDVSGGLNEDNSVLIDEVLDLGSVAAIEVYKRGGNTPSAFHVQGDCGIVALWTGSRKP